MSVPYAGVVQTEIDPVSRGHETDTVTVTVTDTDTATATDTDTDSDPGPWRLSGEGSGVRATWLYTLGSVVICVLVLHVFVLMALVADPVAATGWLRWLVVALMVVSTVTVVRFCWFLEGGVGSGLPRSREVAVVFVPPAALWIVSLAEPGLPLAPALALWSAVNVVAPLLRPRRRAWAYVCGVLAVVAHPVLYGSLHPGPDGSPAISGPLSPVPTTLYAALLPIMVLGSLWWWQIVVRLDESRRLAGDLAVARERLRFAADLHDIQGHHLQVIALKAELAERLLTVDPAAAEANIHETRVIARRALEETRSLVQGYRRVDLDEELANAADVLAAAGIDCHLRAEVAAVGSEAERLLGVVVREATTNILRHSRAAWTSIDLRRSGADLVLEISNDGLDGSSVPGPAEGTGLSGLGRRLAEAGGTVRATVTEERFVLRAVLPAAAEGGVG